MSMRGQPVRATHAGFVLACVMLPALVTAGVCRASTPPPTTGDTPAASGNPCGTSDDNARTSPDCSLPTDVLRFLARRGACDHFRGEVIPDPADDPAGVRRRQIETALRESCTGTDAELARLRAVHRHHVEVMKALSSLEDHVE